jgi:hypothetical protein
VHGAEPRTPGRAKAILADILRKEGVQVGPWHLQPFGNAVIQNLSFSDILRYSRLLLGFLFDYVGKRECWTSKQIKANNSNTIPNFIQGNYR